jgi:hypothetical protein
LAAAVSAAPIHKQEVRAVIQKYAEEIQSWLEAVAASAAHSKVQAVQAAPALFEAEAEMVDLEVQLSLTMAEAVAEALAGTLVMAAMPEQVMAAQAAMAAAAEAAAEVENPAAAHQALAEAV